jgi:hypothetical protein
LEEEKITLYSKPRGETVYVYINEYKGNKYLHIREWYTDANDKIEKPTKKGVTLPIDKVDGLLDALKKLLAE